MTVGELKRLVEYINDDAEIYVELAGGRTPVSDGYVFSPPSGAALHLSMGVDFERR